MLAVSIQRIRVFTYFCLNYLEMYFAVFLWPKSGTFTPQGVCQLCENQKLKMRCKAEVTEKGCLLSFLHNLFLLLFCSIWYPFVEMIQSHGSTELTSETFAPWLNSSQNIEVKYVLGSGSNTVGSNNLFSWKLVIIMCRQVYEHLMAFRHF